MLKEMNHIPDAFLDAKAEDLHDILQAATLFHLEGTNPQPLFICTLLHGDETTGLYAMQRLLKKYQEPDQIPKHGQLSLNIIIIRKVLVNLITQMVK